MPKVLIFVKPTLFIWVKNLLENKLKRLEMISMFIFRGIYFSGSSTYNQISLSTPRNYSDSSSRKKDRKNSSNSGLPPSQGFDSNGNRNKKVDNKAAHRTGGRLDNSKDLETSETVTPKKCSECNGELKKAKVTSTEERQEIDITYEIHTHTVVSETKECPQCGFENKGQFPEGIDGPIQYGIGIKAGIIDL